MSTSTYVPSMEGFQVLAVCIKVENVVISSASSPRILQKSAKGLPLAVGDQQVISKIAGGQSEISITFRLIEIVQHESAWYRA